MDKGGDYLLALKDNNRNLHKQVTEAFEACDKPGRQAPFFGKAR